MSKKRPWMPLYVSDYLLDTLDLHADQSGVYLTILMLAWRRPDGAIPNDMKWLKRSLAACLNDMHGNRFNRLVPPLLERFFDLGEDGKFRNKRLTKEREKTEKFSEKQKENAEKRWARLRENNELADATAMPARALHSHSQSQLQEERKKDSPAPLASLAGAPPTIPDTPVPDTKPKAPPRIVVNNGPDRPPDKPPDKPKRARTPGRPIPNDWKPNETHARLAAKEGYDLDDIEAHFRDVTSSKEHLYHDHDAAFRNHIRNQKNFKRGNNGVQENPNPKRGSILSALDESIEHLERQVALDREMRPALIPKLSEH